MYVIQIITDASEYGVNINVEGDRQAYEKLAEIASHYIQQAIGSDRFHGELKLVFIDEMATVRPMRTLVIG